MTSAEGPVSFVHDDHTTVTLRRGAMAFVGVVRVALRHHRSLEAEATKLSSNHASQGEERKR